MKKKTIKILIISLLFIIYTGTFIIIDKNAMSTDIIGYTRDTTDSYYRYFTLTSSLMLIVAGLTGIISIFLMVISRKKYIDYSKMITMYIVSIIILTVSHFLGEPSIGSEVGYEHTFFDKYYRYIFEFIGYAIAVKIRINMIKSMIKKEEKSLKGEK